MFMVKTKNGGSQCKRRKAADMDQRLFSGLAIWKIPNRIKIAPIASTMLIGSCRITTPAKAEQRVQLHVSRLISL